MGLQTLQESVTVTAEAPVIEVTRTDVAQVITQEQIDTLPMSDRQPASLVLLLPGTNMDNTQVRRAQANIGAGGINNQMNAYFVDGASNWSTNSGQQHAEMPQMAVREFRVNVAQASAEHGGNVAGLVSTVTRSGTNRFSGEVLEYFRDKSLNAITRDQLRRSARASRTTGATSGASGIGGPIIRDRAHFYGAIEFLTEKKSFTVNSGAAAVLRRAARHVPDRLPAAEVLRARRRAAHQNAEPLRALRARQGAHRLRGVRRHERGVLRRLRRVAARHARDRAHLGDQFADAERPARAVAGAPSPRHRTSRNGEVGRAGRVPATSGSRGSRRSTTSRACTGARTATALNWTNRFEIKEDFSHVRGQHQFKFGGEYAQYISPEDVTANRGTWTFGQDQFFDGSAAAIANLRSPTHVHRVVPAYRRGRCRTTGSTGTCRTSGGLATT